MNKRVGPVFKQGTKRVWLKTDQRIIYQICYTHHNVIHHGLAKRYDAWEFSSYLAYEGGKTKISREYIIELMGGLDSFHQIHDNFASSWER